MRLDFNILWVEDQPTHVQAQRERIDFLLRREGFRLQVVFAASIAEADRYLSSDIYGDHIDLVLMDYDLGVAPHGNDGLVAVRRRFAYKDIIFYSARVPDLLGMVTAKHVQGIFCSTRDDLPDTVSGLFETLVKKVLDIDHCRGIVMGATSDIDHFVNECLEHSYNVSSDEGRAAVWEMVAERLAEIRKRFEKGEGKAHQARSIPELVELHYIYTSTDRLNLLRAVLETVGHDAAQIDKLKGYVFNTIPSRNNLAHLRVQQDGFSRKLLDRHGIEMTTAEMKELRSALLEIQELLEALVTTFSAPTE